MARPPTPDSDDIDGDMTDEQLMNADDQYLDWDQQYRKKQLIDAKNKKLLETPDEQIQAIE